jgi:hypothetical protein
MYVIYGNIYHQYTSNVSTYTSTMDPMGNDSDMVLWFTMNHCGDICYSSLLLWRISSPLENSQPTRLAIRWLGEFYGLWIYQCQQVQYESSTSIAVSISLSYIYKY